jgi:hypothetical protein
MPTPSSPPVSPRGTRFDKGWKGGMRGEESRGEQRRARQDRWGALCVCDLVCLCNFFFVLPTVHPPISRSEPPPYSTAPTHFEGRCCLDGLLFDRRAHCVSARQPRVVSALPARTCVLPVWHHRRHDPRRHPRGSQTRSCRCRPGSHRSRSRYELHSRSPRQFLLIPLNEP